MFGHNPFQTVKYISENYQSLQEMAMPTSKKQSVIDMIKIADEDVVEEILKVLSKKIIQDATVQLFSGAGSPESSQKALENAILTSSRLTIDETIEFLRDVESGKYDKKMESLLLKAGSTTFDEIKGWHPFLNKIFDELVTMKAGLGTGISRAGDGEYFFIMMGATKPKSGDVSFKGKEIEIKADGADMAPSKKAGYPVVAKDYAKHTAAAASKVGTKYPNQQMTLGGNQKFIDQYGEDKWFEFFKEYLNIMFPKNTASGNKNAMAMLKGFKKYEPATFEKQYSNLVFKCMFEDDKLDAICVVSKKRKLISTITNYKQRPDGLLFKVSQYLIPR